MKDSLSDMLTRIRNGQQAKLMEIPLFWPTSRFCLRVLKSLQKEGYIRGIKKGISNEKSVIFVLLKYTENQHPIISKIIRISKPGKRIYSASKNFWKINNGKGIFFISTSYGLVTDREARRLNVGGEIVFYIE